MSGLKKAYKNGCPSRRQARHVRGGPKGQAREAFPRRDPGSQRGNAPKRGGPGPPRPLIFPHGPQVPEGDRGRHGIPWAARARPGDGHRPRARLAEASRRMADVPGAMPRGAGTAPGAPCSGALRVGSTSEGGDAATRPLAGTAERPRSITGPLAHQRKAEASHRAREAGAMRPRGPPMGARLPSGGAARQRRPARPSVCPGVLVCVSPSGSRAGAVRKRGAEALRARAARDAVSGRTVKRHSPGPEGPCL